MKVSHATGCAPEYLHLLWPRETSLHFESRVWIVTKVTRVNLLHVDCMMQTQPWHEWIHKCRLCTTVSHEVYEIWVPESEKLVETVKID